MNSRQGLNLSRIQRQGNAISYTGVHSQYPSSDSHSVCTRTTWWDAAHAHSVGMHARWQDAHINLTTRAALLWRQTCVCCIASGCMREEIYRSQP